VRLLTYVSTVDYIVWRVIQELVYQKLETNMNELSRSRHGQEYSRASLMK